MFDHAGPLSWVKKTLNGWHSLTHFPLEDGTGVPKDHGMFTCGAMNNAVSMPVDFM